MNSLAEVSGLTLGTAQLGLRYGIANKKGKLTDEEALNILQVAYSEGINSFDTAFVYGESERILGRFLSSLKKRLYPVVISKLPRISVVRKERVRKQIEKYLNTSLQRLGIERMPVYLLHSASDLSAFDGEVIRVLSEMKKDGLIGAIGVSVYHPEEAKNILDMEEIEVIQLPLSIFDRRFLKSDLLTALKSRGKFIFARSIFLQGLIFLSPRELPRTLESAAQYLEILREFVRKEEMSIDELAMGFVRSFPQISSIVIGVEDLNQLKGNIKLYKKGGLSIDVLEKVIQTFPDMPETIVNPYHWREKK